MAVRTSSIGDTRDSADACRNFDIVAVQCAPDHSAPSGNGGTHNGDGIEDTCGDGLCRTGHRDEVCQPSRPEECQQHDDGNGCVPRDHHRPDDARLCEHRVVAFGADAGKALGLEDGRQPLIRDRAKFYASAEAEGTCAGG